MKLSEAIRLGTMATTQGFGAESFYSDTAPCALGAARLAAGCYAYYDSLIERWPWLERYVETPPVLSLVKGKTCEALEAIYLLNDIGGWTREQIADWIEGIERAQEIADGQVHASQSVSGSGSQVGLGAQDADGVLLAVSD